MTHDHPLLLRLGENVRALRKARGWSRADLARHTGISLRFLADVESGTANPSLLRLCELAQALGTEVQTLLAGASLADPRERPVRHVALLGLRGAGKSTVGPLLAVRLGRAFVELDDRIESETGLRIAELFQLHGEAYYRQAERQALEQVLAGPACVLAVGGGLVTEPATFSLLRAVATTIWLRAEPEDHWQRVLAQGDTRPMADNERAFQDLRRILAAREPLYRQANLVVDTANRPVAVVVEALCAGLPDRSAPIPSSR
ncbi:MAG: helix-turn-helix domain-containing protein [Planctomycetes bacterium]|nr:helix-turn-helix domain-containing protein [Planctomycetota bacterium]